MPPPLGIISGLWNSSNAVRPACQVRLETFFGLTPDSKRTIESL